MIQKIAPNLAKQPWLTIPGLSRREKERLTTLQTWSRPLLPIRPLSPLRRGRTRILDFPLLLRLGLTTILWDLATMKQLIDFLQGCPWVCEILGIQGELPYATLYLRVREYQQNLQVIYPRKNDNNRPILVFTAPPTWVKKILPRTHIRQFLLSNHTINAAFQPQEHTKTTVLRSYHYKYQLHLLTTLDGGVTLGFTLSLTTNNKDNAPISRKLVALAAQTNCRRLWGDGKLAKLTPTAQEFGLTIAPLPPIQRRILQTLPISSTFARACDTMCIHGNHRP
ncbi:hypothetical protein [Pasteuria penetrans]|uniref:hypothetical protein n=1 Tax=Pasteuria penetrans TaxID=86005 RepID=UPI0011ECDAEA|nr:hypothetical protein [Pasteuria penetrans]